ncbi:MAG: DMT family transporter [Ignavibacteriales bacterium]|nr:MAG: DMT family transporter [Ignavibacteriales bacterium]
MQKQFTRYWKPITAVVFWGVSFIATKVALDELDPLTIIFLRLILAVIFLAAIAVYTKRDFSLNLKNHGGIFILALIAVFHLWIQVTGLQYTTAAKTGWIIGTAPVFMALLGVLAFNESLTFLKITGIIIAFFGLILLISNGSFASINIISNKGDFLILGSAFTWAVYSAVNKKITLSYPPMMTIFFLFLMMGIIISPFTINNTSIESVLHLSAIGWVSIFFLGILCSGAAYVIWASALKEMESAKVGAFLYFEPFITIIAAWIILNEEITLLMILAGLIITIGVVLVNLNLKTLWKKRTV